jgi:2-isopropylmalate synthase
MVEKSREKGLNAHVMSATQLPYEKEFDAVFSNAVLHWVKESSLAVEKIYNSLKEGGRFVAEFGGEGNIEHIRMAMKEVFSSHEEYGEFNDPWFFPSVESYENILKSSGFKVEYIERIPRPTPIDDIAHWLDIFANGIASNLTEEQKVVFKSEVREILKNKIHTKEHGWVADYVRLRVRVVKI